LYYTLAIGTLLLVTAIVYASLQYQTVLYEIVDLLLFSFLVFAFGSLWISTRGQGQEHPIFWVCFTLGFFTALALSGLDVYTVRPPEVLNDAYYTFTVLSIVAEVAVITLGYFVVAIVLKKGIEAYREDQ